MYVYVCYTIDNQGAEQCPDTGGSIMNYKTATVQQLFKAYQFENNRIDQHDARITKAHIRQELTRRLNQALAALNEVDDISPALEEEKVEIIYNYFLYNKKEATP